MITSIMLYKEEHGEYINVPVRFESKLGQNGTESE